MKKLVVLALVLGLASVSLAGPVPLTNTSHLTAVLSGTTLTISGDAAPTVANDQWQLGIDYDASVAYSDGASTAAAGDLRNIAIAGNGFDVIIGGSVSLATAGDWFTVEVSGLSVGTELSVWDYGLDSTGYTLAAGETVTVTPEPMTLALLGLGGLFLRRRS